jgi:uncharacterized SAM-binding protein YcdF (DUF218 family)
MTGSTNAAPRSQPRRSARVIVTWLAVLLVLSLFVFLFGVGRWLVIEDPLEKAQAIVVLSGRLPIRAIEAARLFHAGYASQVWLTRPEEPATSLQAMNIPYRGEEFFHARVLEHEGVPSGAIRVLDPPINNTADEVRVVAAELAGENGSAVILVTTKAHTRRVRGLWRKLSGGHRRAIVRAAAGDSFDPSHWWRTSGDALDVVREVLGLLNAWAGLPLHPGP